MSQQKARGGSRGTVLSEEDGSNRTGIRRRGSRTTDRADSFHGHCSLAVKPVVEFSALLLAPSAEEAAA
jgi:hypothetical protein